MEESESETSSSSGSSSSTSCSESGSSSDSESSSSVAPIEVEEKSVATSNNTKATATNQRQRRSSEFKANTNTKTTGTENEKAAPPTTNTTTTSSSSKQKQTTQMSAASKVRAVASQRNVCALSSESDDEDEVPPPPPPPKKTPVKRKTSVSASKPIARNISAAKSKANNTRSAIENGDRKNAAADCSSTNESEDSVKETKRKVPPKMAATSNNNVRGKQLRKKMPPKQTTLTKASQAVAAQCNNKSSDSSESGSESGSGSGEETSSASESEDSDSTNSYSSQPNNSKNNKQRRNGGGGSGGGGSGGGGAIAGSSGGGGVSKQTPRSGSEDNVKAKPHPMRKLTRSLSMRRTKQQVKQQQGSDSDTDADAELDNRVCLTKSPAKKPASSFSSITATKSKVKKETTSSSSFMHIKSRPISPLAQLEKKCPIEGCDSSGHLSGNLDRHFLPEACPIYHNMSASECKERANERKLRSEQRQKSHINHNAVAHGTTTVRTLTTEQKEFLAKIRESRASFQPIKNNTVDKVKLEKDCSDEDREPNLAGLVPDYDLQLFREAQALASEKIEDELKDLPVGKGIKYITMGKYKMKVWYQSPYPDDAARLPKMYICEFCLRYQKSETGIKRHAQKCVWRHPPGDEIYRKGKLQVWQVDGKRYKQYCQHLCLLAKFFLDHKTLYYDVEPFLFYIMTLADVDGCHIVGYFSKEKNSFYNVSCILTLPPYQRKGYGRLLIDFSYLLTRVEGKIGSPEKPLSDLGLISYRSYWKDVLLDYLCNRTGNTLSIKDVSQEMAIYSYDIVSTLQWLGMMKYWKGKHIVLKKQDVLDEYEERVKRRGTFPKIDDSCLRWQPFVPAQTNSSP